MTDSSSTTPPDDPDRWLRPEWIAQTQILLDSYRRWTGRELLPRDGSPRDQAEALDHAPFVVVSHGTE